MKETADPTLPDVLPARKLRSLAKKYAKASSSGESFETTVAALVAAPGFLEVVSDDVVPYLFAAQTFGVISLPPADIDRLRLRFKSTILPRVEQAQEDFRLSAGGNAILAPGDVSHDNLWLINLCLNPDSVSKAELAEIELFLPIILGDVLGRYLKFVSSEVTLSRTLTRPAPVRIAAGSIGVGATVGFTLFSLGLSLQSLPSLTALPAVVQVSASALAGGLTGVAVILTKARSYENRIIADASSSPSWGSQDYAPPPARPVSISDLRERVESAGLSTSSSMLLPQSPAPALALPPASPKELPLSSAGSLGM